MTNVIDARDLFALSQQEYRMSKILEELNVTKDQYDRLHLVTELQQIEAGYLLGFEELNDTEKEIWMGRMTRVCSGQYELLQY